MLIALLVISFVTLWLVLGIPRTDATWIDARLRAIEEKLDKLLKCGDGQFSVDQLLERRRDRQWPPLR